VHVPWGWDEPSVTGMTEGSRERGFFRQRRPEWIGVTAPAELTVPVHGEDAAVCPWTRDGEVVGCLWGVGYAIGNWTSVR